MTNPASPQQNAPVTGASITAAAGLVCVALGLSAEWIAAINAVVGIVAALAVQRWHTDPKEKNP